MIKNIKFTYKLYKFISTLTSNVDYDESEASVICKFELIISNTKQKYFEIAQSKTSISRKMLVAILVINI